MSDQKNLISYLLPYLNLDFNLSIPGLTISTDVKASVLGLTKDEYTSFLGSFDERAKSIAIEMLKDDDILHQLNKLPFKHDETLLVYGDAASNTQGGWVDVLRYVIELGTEKDITIKNKSLPMVTSSFLLQHFGTRVLTENPDWILFNFGLWDAFSPNYASDRTLVGMVEFWENIESLKIASESLKNRNPILWMPPSFVIEEAVNENPLYNGTFTNTVIQNYQEVMRDKEGVQIDPFCKRFGNPVEQWYFIADGINYSDSGIVATVKTILSTLASL